MHCDVHRCCHRRSSIGCNHYLITCDQVVRNDGYGRNANHHDHYRSHNYMTVAILAQNGPIIFAISLKQMHMVQIFCTSLF